MAGTRTKPKPEENSEPITAEARAAVEGLLGGDERSIHQRMIAVLAELPAIGKDQRNEQQKFMYRGHDDVMNALNPLLAKHGIFFVPRVTKRFSSERQTTRGSTMYEVNLLVEITFYGANGDAVLASAWGEGTDMGDKSTNKAMTMALKNVLAQAFAISTAELSDADGGTPEETRRDLGGQPDPSPAPKRDRDKPFDPSKDLLPNAIRGEGYAEALLESLDRLAKDLDWKAILEVAATAAMGPKDKRTAVQRKEGIVRWSNMVAKLEELAQASPEYHPELGIKAGAEGDALVIEAVRFAYGFELSGPLPLKAGEEVGDVPVALPGAEEASDGVPEGEDE